MITKIVSNQIKGKGRGRSIGFPTINLEINNNFVLPIGIYGVWIFINEKKYLGALHYGPTPTFLEKEKSLEVFLIDVDEVDLPTPLPYPVIIEVVGRIRDVKKFATPNDLARQIAKDVLTVRQISAR